MLCFKKAILRGARMMMNLKDALLDARKRYKIRRSKPQLWHFREQGFGYIQIPKVATRSIRQALFDMSGARDPSEAFPAFESRNSAHLSHARIREEVDRGLFVFAFVRHPLARLYSAWMNKIVRTEDATKRNIFSCHGMHDGMPFDAFVRRVSELQDEQLDRHLRSQAWFLSDATGLLPAFVGKLERFGEDWRLLRERLPVLGDVPHKNKASHGMDFLEPYDEETLGLAIARFRRDFELFGYEFPSAGHSRVAV
jgi:dermatan 4-sulfotransferase 1